jgi:hypothetical protein
LAKTEIFPFATFEGRLTTFRMTGRDVAEDDKKRRHEAGDVGSAVTRLRGHGV